MSPKEVLTKHSSRELSEWIAFSRIEPIGQQRGDVQVATLATVMANLWQSEKSKKAKPEDFIPHYRETKRKEKQTWKEQKSFVSMLNTAFGGKVIE